MTLELPSGSFDVIDPFAAAVPGATGEVPIPLEALRDEDSRRVWPSNEMVKHLFAKDAAALERQADAADLGRFVRALDDHGIKQAGIPLLPSTADEHWERLASLDGRVFVTIRANPHDGLRGLRRIEELVRRYAFIRSVSLTPFQIYPFIALDSKEYYPVYAKAAELGLAVFVNVGFPGPRVPAWTQDPLKLDEVCWFFPELTVVMRHGGLPWAETCVQMLLRWPNLYYATTAMTPRHYPKAIIDYANTRGADKVIFAGYFPLLSYDRVFKELAALPIRDHVWPKLLAGNARVAFGLEAGG